MVTSAGPRFKSSAERRAHMYYYFLAVDWNYGQLKFLLMNRTFQRFTSAGTQFKSCSGDALIGITRFKRSTESNFLAIGWNYVTARTP
jgi:hypothetical protein